MPRAGKIYFALKKYRFRVHVFIRHVNKERYVYFTEEKLILTMYFIKDSFYNTEYSVQSRELRRLSRVIPFLSLSVPLSSFVYILL